MSWIVAANVGLDGIQAVVTMLDSNLAFCLLSRFTIFKLLLEIAVIEWDPCCDRTPWLDQCWPSSDLGGPCPARLDRTCEWKGAAASARWDAARAAMDLEKALQMGMLGRGTGRRSKMGGRRRLAEIIVVGCHGRGAGRNRLPLLKKMKPDLVTPDLATFVACPILRLQVVEVGSPASARFGRERSSSALVKTMMGACGL
ncbi:hypothetical protein ACLOJK_037445 [Asimina triloba]